MTALRWGIRLLVFLWLLPAILVTLLNLAALSGGIAYWRARLAWRRRRAA